MNKLFRDILMGLDNETYDIGKVLWVIGVFVYLGLSITALIKGQTWDPQAYGIGMGAVLAGGGVAMGMKKGTEHVCNNSDQTNTGAN